MNYDLSDLRTSLGSRALTLLWLIFAIGGCKDSNPSAITGATNSGGAGSVSATAAAGAAHAATGAGSDARPSGAAGTAGMLAGTGISPGTARVTPAPVAGASAAVGGNASPSAVGGAGAGGSGAGGSGASSAGSNGAAGAAGKSASATGTTFPPAKDLGMNGPYMAMTVMNTGPSGTYTIYRPAELAPGGAKNPIVGWMSGGGSTPSQYTLLPHLASHGFVVVASNTSPALGDEEKLGKEIIAGIEWVIAENAKSDSAYHDKLDATKIASMGYSMGALATTVIGGDPRLTTTVHISSGNMTTDRVKKLHAPAAFLCGASGVDIAGANCATDFEAATTPVFYGVFNGGDHLGVRTQPYADRIRLVVTAWLRWQLMGDTSLAPMFVGDQCTVCKDTNWTVKQKNLM